ncbi:MAG: tRNA 2-thiouridine(34) synthase MnmA [Anaerolineales bacterium]|nr:tRNA 2-thiouridine(34) synthase MnmA [Anaerolineales bacterium]
MTKNERIAVAMSGGVDSSVAAALLVEQGFEVFGLMMRLWSPGPDFRNRCCSPEDITIARNIAAQLGIPFHVLDIQERFKSQVVDTFTSGYAQGITPNPCLACNRQIRWGFLLQTALAMGATHLATGHYACVEKRNDHYVLLRAKDRSKDQSYVLSVLGQYELSHARFPLCDLSKKNVRQHARRLALPIAERTESQDLCFVANGDYRRFLRQQGVSLPPPGPILDTSGKLLGNHDSLADFTIGQRKGIGVTMPHALYVLEKDVASNALIVGPRNALDRHSFLAGPINWTAGRPPALPIRALVRVRYKAQEVMTTIRPEVNDFVSVYLEKALPDVTPGQAAVFYSDDECLGGGIIQP